MSNNQTFKLRHRIISFILGISFVALGITGLIATGVHFYKSLKISLKHDSFLEIKGKVIELQYDYRKKVYDHIIEFYTVQNKKITFKSDISSTPPSYSKGESVNVLYNRHNPQEAYVTSLGQNMTRVLIGSIVILFGSALFLFLGYIFFMNTFYKYEYQEKMLKSQVKRELPEKE